MDAIGEMVRLLESGSDAVDTARHNLDDGRARADRDVLEPSLAESVLYPVQTAAVALPSGRRVELEAGAVTDRIVVRARGGEVVLRIEVGDAGPVLSFTSAELVLAASGRLELRAEDIVIAAERDVRIAAGRNFGERVAGDRHARVDGAERVEAATVEIQANTANVAVRAMQRVAIDGEHIGLNDERCLAPFAWSRLEDGTDEGSEP